jgi:hypothetical protein
LILAKLWVGDIFIGQNFGTTELMDTDCFHKPLDV